METNGLILSDRNIIAVGAASGKQQAAEFKSADGIFIELIRIMLIDGHETNTLRVILERKSTFSSRLARSASFIIDRNQAYMLIIDSHCMWTTKNISVPLVFDFTSLASTNVTLSSI